MGRFSAYLKDIITGVFNGHRNDTGKYICDNALTEFEVYNDCNGQRFKRENNHELA